jgi:hypothetical protein
MNDPVCDRPDVSPATQLARRVFLTRTTGVALGALALGELLPPRRAAAEEGVLAQIRQQFAPTARRVIFARKLLGVIRGPENAEFWDRHKHEFAVYVTKLPTSCNAWQIQELYRQRADTENVFDELKNQWSFSGFAAK